MASLTPDAPASTETFTVEPPRFDGRRATFSYRLGDLAFTETLDFPGDPVPTPPSFTLLLNVAAFVLGVSYFKLRAPFVISSPIALTEKERAFVTEVYEDGLGEFYARNDLKRFGRLTFEVGDRPNRLQLDRLPRRALVPIGGGKDSLVSVQLLEMAGIDYAPFAVNPKGPIVSSIGAIGRPPLYVRRTLDPEMIRLGKEPGYYNGHVPSTAIISMIAALSAILFGFNHIVMSNERSASEGNTVFDGREVNHQYSKSIEFERRIAGIMGSATGGALQYYSLLRPYSEAKIARLFARETKFDRVFSSCNRNFTIEPHQGPLWCGQCPKCHFVFLILAPAMDKARLIDIFGGDLLDRPQNEASFRELTGLAGQKPWECVGEILEAAACLHVLGQRPEWRDTAIVSRQYPDLLTQYGSERLDIALSALMSDGTDHLIPESVLERIAGHAS